MNSKYIAQASPLSLKKQQQVWYTHHSVVLVNRRVSLLVWPFKILVNQTTTKFLAKLEAKNIQEEYYNYSKTKHTFYPPITIAK